LAAQFKNSEMEMPMKKASTRFVLLVLSAASLSAALTLPVLAQNKPSTIQNCGNASTARDKQLKPDARCLMTSEQYLEAQAKKPQPSAVKDLGPEQRWSPTGVYLGPGERWSPLGLPGPHVNYNDIKNGNGGSGGGRGKTSAR
jgi:hypothetical protein